MNEFNKELDEFIKSVKPYKDEIMAKNSINDEKGFSQWCKNVVQGTRTFKNLFSVEITIRFKDIAIINFTIPSKK